MAVRGVISSRTGRSAKASTPETTAISSVLANASVSALVSSAARVVRVEPSRRGMKGDSTTPNLSSIGTARPTSGSAQRRPSTRGTRYAAPMNSGTPTVMVKIPRKVGVVAASNAGMAPAASSTPRVVSMLAVARVRPGFWSTFTVAADPRSLYATQRVSSCWLTVAAATPIAADTPATTSPRSNTANATFMLSRRRPA